MFKYVLKRIGLMLLTFLIIVSICFVLIRLLPHDTPDSFNQDAALVENRRELLGYNKPMIEQWFIFITRTLFGGDWGMSEKKYFGQDCWDIFVEFLPPTVLLNVYSLFFSVPLGIIFGIYAALKKNKWQDAFISTGVMVFVSVPSYVYAFLVQFILCFKLEWFPMIMKEGTDWFSWPMFHSMIPAILSLSFGTIAGLTRFTRAELTEVLTSEFMLLARTKGLTKRQATYRHALRNAMVPILPMIIGEFIAIMGGSLIIEEIFGVPGTGALYIESISNLDYNFFMLLSAFYTFIGLAANILVDISYGFIDPRIRVGER